MSPLLQFLNKTLKFLLIGVVVELSIEKCLRMIGNRITSMFKYYTNNILRGIIFDLKWLSEVSKLQYRCSA